jgi:protein-L-isoaspartate O-methyltransferase
MLIPVGGKRIQEFVCYDKIGPNKVKKKKMVTVSFVPLTSQEEQLSLR